MPAERVVIDIEVNSDIATIEATRRALEDLTDAQRRYNRERDREPRGGGGGGGGGGSGDSDDDGRSGRGGRGGRRVGRRGGRRGNGRYDGFGGQVFDFRGDAGKMIGMFGGLLKLVNKLAMISLPLMMAGLGAISLAFRMGTYFVNMYKAAMSSLAGAVAFAYIALTTLLAAQREFSAVQNSPQYIKGNLYTADRFVATANAMSMFVDSSQLAVVSSKSLQSAFSTLSKQKPVTAATTAAFTSVMDVVAGSGGDMDKGAEKLANFFAKMQKTGTVAGASAEAKELGPDFEKILKEAGAMGIKTADEFDKAAAAGKLGETFATKYAGTLDALNDTVMGRFKGAVSSIKAQLTDLGGEYLGETGGAISRLQGIVSGFITRLSFVMSNFDVAGKMGSFLDLVQKSADKLILVMTKYLGATPNIFGFLGDGFNKIANAFDAMQDWMRQFQAAGEAINKYFFSPLFNALGSSFTASMSDLAEVIESNGPAIESFANQIADTLIAIGKYGDVVRRLFLGAMPALSLLLKVVEMFFNGLAAFGKTAIAIADKFAKVFGKTAGAAIKLAALYALFTIATRFFKILGMMFGRNMKQPKTMNVQAGVVNVNGSGMPGTGTGAGTSARPTRREQFRGMAQSAGYSAATFGTGLALTAGGAGLMHAGGKAGGFETAKGSSLKTAGLAAMGTGAVLMMVPGQAVASLGTALTGATGGAGAFAAGAGAIALPVAAAAAAFGSGAFIGSKFKDDSVKSRGLATLAGATSGAAFGVGVGAFFGGPVGAAVGAAIGAAIGGAAAFIKSGKQRREIRQAAGELVDGYREKLDDAFAGGNVDDLMKARDQMILDRDALVNTSADPAYAAQALRKYNKEFEELNSAIDTYASNVNISSRYLNTGAETLNKLAAAAGIDLQTKMLTFRDVLGLVAKTAEEKAKLLKAAFANIGANAVASSLSYFDKKAESKEQGKAINAAGLRLLGGDESEESQDDYLKKLIQFNVGKYGDVSGMTNSFVSLEQMLGEGGRFAGLDEATKQNMRKELALAGVTPEGILANLDIQELTDLSGGMGLGQFYGADGKLNPQLIQDFLKKNIADDPLFLSKYINAISTEDQGKGAVAAQALVRGAVAGSVPMVSDSVSRRYGSGSVPATVTPDTFIANTTINAAMLDGKTIDQIEKAIAKAIKEAQERGATGSTSDTRRNS